MEKLLLIGEILKPHGIMGEMKAKSFADSFQAIKRIKTVSVDGEIRKVLSIKDAGDSYYITLSQIADRTSAEGMRGKKLYCEREQINKCDNEFFIVDVIGCNLYNSQNVCLGKIIDINVSNVDIYRLKLENGKEAVFPMIKALEPVFDIENQKVTVDSSKFDEVVIYEN